MDWSDSIHPFDEVARECFEEIGHEVDLENTFLYGFGIDLQKLYFQFSFFEKTRCSSQEIIDKSKLARDYYAEMEYIEAVPFELIEIINLLKNQRWEPAAAVGLVSLCTKEYGRYQVEKAIDPDYVRINEREGMTYEWNRRAQRKGVSAVMSARYPSYRCEQESQKYVNAVMDFIGNDINDKDVLEIGCGIGRLTKKLILKAKKLTCLDISQEMIDRNKAYLGALASKVDYFQEFAQDYSPNKTHQVIISSLVLIHNIDDDEFYKLVKKMSSCADEIFLFEHTDVACQVSPFTRIRSVTELESAFYEYEVTKRSEYKIFDDSISFLKLVRKCPNSCRNGILNEMDKEKNETVLNMDVSKDPLNRLYCQNILLN
jgi:SAM-dependent methyltransferase